MGEFWDNELSIGYYDKIVKEGFKIKKALDLTGIYQH